MKNYLKLSVGANLNVVSLTATTPEVHAGPPSEEIHSRPTHSNIVAHLGRIADQAKPGNRLVIFFAGHGTYIPKDATHALIVLAKDGVSKQYLRLDALHRRVEVLLAKGLFITLILDCCFSGATVRGDHDLTTRSRCLDFGPNVAVDTEPLISSSENPMIMRDPVMEFDWLKYDASLVVFCACAPHERTFETLVNGRIQGLFTHCLLHVFNMLLKNGTIITHKAIHDHLGTSLYADWPRQTPMRYGKADDVFFGGSLLAPQVVDATMGRMPSISAIERQLTGPQYRRLSILRHVAEFKYIEGLEDQVPCPKLQASFRVSSNTPSGSSNKIDVMRDDKIKFTFTNTSHEQLYIFTFNFGPTWRLRALQRQRFKILPARQGDKNVLSNVAMSFRWREDLPALTNQYRGDHIKFLITNDAAFFDWSLPTIFKKIEGSDDNHRGNSDALHACLASFLGGLRDGNDSRSTWTTQSFFFRLCSGEVASNT